VRDLISRSAGVAISLAAASALSLSSTTHRIILRQTTFADALKAGEIKAEGKQAELARFFSFFDAPVSEPPALTAR